MSELFCEPAQQTFLFSGVLQPAAVGRGHPMPRGRHMLRPAFPLKFTRSRPLTTHGASFSSTHSAGNLTTNAPNRGQPGQSMAQSHGRWPMVNAWSLPCLGPFSGHLGPRLLTAPHIYRLTRTTSPNPTAYNVTSDCSSRELRGKLVRSVPVTQRLQHSIPSSTLYLFSWTGPPCVSPTCPRKLTTTFASVTLLFTLSVL